MVKLSMIKKMSYKIIGKYIKELDFKIPNTKTFFLLSKNISNYRINIDIKSVQIKKNIIEILTSIKLNPLKKDLENINTKIVYSTIIELENEKMKKEELERIILIDVPSKIYFELREIFIFLFKNSGFKDVKISKNIDFEKLYSLKKVQ
jgi:preprotein translocase subunit SecB